MFWTDGLSEELIALADEATTEYKEILKETSVRIGNLLLKMKAALPHGNFQPWYEQELKLKQPAATQHMQAAKFYAEQVAKDGNSIVCLDNSKPSAMAIAQTLEPEVKEQLMAEAKQKGKLTTTAAKQARKSHLKVVESAEAEITTQIQESCPHPIELVKENDPEDTSTWTTSYYIEQLEATVMRLIKERDEWMDLANKAIAEAGNAVEYLRQVTQPELPESTAEPVVKSSKVQAIAKSA
jgi:hypothetical protein